MSHSLPEIRPTPPAAKCSRALPVLQDFVHTDLPRIDALYVHVPFCFHKCHYCDFYSLVDEGAESRAAIRGEDRQAAYTRRLIDELNLRATQFTLRPETVFVGGGTPTFLRVELWRQLLQALRDAGALAQVREFTVEANPETVTAELAAVLATGGVKRVSIGAQSFDPALLKMLERWHDPRKVRDAVNHFRGAGVTNINLDLIFAIPGQTLDLLDRDLDAALALEPLHLSCYNLTYEPHTAMTQRLRQGQITPVTEDVERAMYQRVIDRLAAAGFEHYEVSNWARPTLRCQHNMLYWTNGSWLGLGASAASHVAGYRWKNEAHLGHYLGLMPEPATVDHEHLDAARRAGELLMLRLRLREGAPLTWLADALPPDDARHARIAELINIGLLEKTATHLRLTDRGLFVADRVLAELL